jgi:quercetin dioxygenase-like cupin family protein
VISVSAGGAARGEPPSPVPPPDRAADAHHRLVPLFENGDLKARTRPYEVVSGDPDKAGAPFVIRIFNLDNQVVPPHWHPEDEHIVVVKGTWLVGGGDRFDRGALRELAVGDYVFVPKKMSHFALSKGETVIQVHGIGPFKINFTDPWLRLSRPADAPRFKFKAGARVRAARGEGFVREGFSSEKNAVTQYIVEKDDGGAFWEFEAELEARPAVQ